MQKKLSWKWTLSQLSEQKALTFFESVGTETQQTGNRTVSIWAFSFFIITYGLFKDPSLKIYGWFLKWAKKFCSRKYWTHAGGGLQRVLEEQFPVAFLNGQGCVGFGGGHTAELQTWAPFFVAVFQKVIGLQPNCPVTAASKNTQDKHPSSGKLFTSSFKVMQPANGDRPVRK